MSEDVKVSLVFDGVCHEFYFREDDAGHVMDILGAVAERRLSGPTGVNGLAGDYALSMKRGWTIGNKGGNIERGLIALITKDFSNTSDKDLQAAEDLYGKVSRLMERVNQGYMTRKQAADEMGVDIAEVDAENERDLRRLKRLHPSMWTTLSEWKTLPDEVDVAGTDAQADGPVTFVTRHADGTFEHHS